MVGSDKNFCHVIIVCMEQYTEKLMYELADGLLSSEKRINEILDLVNQNLDEKEMMKALKEIRYRDNIPYEHQ